MSRSRKRPRTSLKHLPESFIGEGWGVPEPKPADQPVSAKPKLTSYQRVRHKTLGWEGVLLFALVQSDSWAVAWDEHPKATHKTEDLEGV